MNKWAGNFFAIGLLAFSGFAVANCASIHSQENQTYRVNEQNWVYAKENSTYTLSIINDCDFKIAAHVEVQGKSTLKDKGSYIVPAHGTFFIKGWREGINKYSPFIYEYSYNLFSTAPKTGYIKAQFFKETNKGQFSLEPFEEDTLKYTNAKGLSLLGINVVD